MTKKKMTREAAEAKCLLLDELQVKLLTKLWAEFEKSENYNTSSNAREIFSAVNFLPKTTALVLELAWAKAEKMYLFVVNCLANSNTN